jgi:hypothetical protein
MNSSRHLHFPYYGTAWFKQQLFHSSFFCSRPRNLSHSADIDFTFQNYLDGTLLKTGNKQIFCIRKATDDLCVSVRPLLQLTSVMLSLIGRISWCFMCCATGGHSFIQWPTQPIRCWYIVNRITKFKLTIVANAVNDQRLLCLLLCTCLSNTVKNRLCDTDNDNHVDGVRLSPNCDHQRAYCSSPRW